MLQKNSKLFSSDDMQSSTKRLFFGLEAEAPWPKDFPPGRLIPKPCHMTLAFLGQIEWQNLAPLLERCPLPSFECGLAGVLDQLLFLPKGHPRVVCYHVETFEAYNLLATYQKLLQDWLCQAGFLPKNSEGKFLPHISIARAPFDKKPWEEIFEPLPVVFKAVHLYESLGNLHYKPLWSSSLAQPWDEIEHTADIAFCIRGKTLKQIYMHAKLALAFHYPPLLSHEIRSEPQDLDEVIMQLNELIGLTDQTVGCPFKAVSLHGQLLNNNELLQWEMIVDV